MDKQLSELMDEELDIRDREKLYDRMKKDADMLEKWGRYHMVSDALKNNLGSHIDLQLRDRIRSAIEQEPALLVINHLPTPSSDTTDSSSHAATRRTSLPYAVAASLAVVGLLGVQLAQQWVDPTLDTDQLVSAPRGDVATEFVAGTVPYQGTLEVLQSGVAAIGEGPTLINSRPLTVLQNPTREHRTLAAGQWLRTLPSGERINQLDQAEMSSGLMSQRGIVPYAHVVTYELNGPK